ncbi:MAG: D-xylose 1-dehydrogenase Gfo6 [Halanaeroarchaeum sp.]
MDDSLLADVEYRDWADDVSGTVRFALVGMGWWTTEFVIPAIEASEHCETTTVVSGGAEKRERAVADHESITTALSYDEFVAGDGADEYDAVYVCTPNALHLEYVEAAVERGKDVLVEKPMEATEERAAALVDAAESADDATVMVAYRMHTEPTARYARALVRDGVIGTPQLVHGQMSQVLLDVIEDPDQWRLDPDLSGYGTSVMDIGIYPLNTARFVLDADPVAVQSMMSSEASAFAAVPDEVATIEVAFDDGTLATVGTSQNAAETSRLDIIGTDGRIAMDPAFHGVTELTVSVGDETVSVDLPQVDQMEEEFEYFATRLLADEPVHADPAHGLTDMATIAAIHEAAETAERVDVDR